MFKFILRYGYRGRIVNRRPGFGVGSGVIEALDAWTDARVVVAFRTPVIPYLSRMTSKIEG